MSLRQIKTVAVLAIFLGSTSCFLCLMPGDGILRVSGNIVDINGGPVNGCVLNLHLEDDVRLSESEDVNGEFEVSFI